MVVAILNMYYKTKKNAKKITKKTKQNKLNKIECQSK